MKTRYLLAGLAVVLVITIAISSIFIFDIFHRQDNNLLQTTPLETPHDGTQLYVTVGTKHVSRAAIDFFERHRIPLEITGEEDERVTSLDDFFIMGSSIPDDIDRLAENPNQYRLVITGDVEAPLVLSYEDLLTQFEMKHMVTELYCMPSLTGIGKFSGPSLYDVIRPAKPFNDNAKVVVIAADGYEKGWSNEFPLAEIDDHRDDYLLAVAMNGYPLAIEHGYPARLALASKAGLLWVKWVDKIVIVPEDATRDYLTHYPDNIVKDTGIRYPIE